MVLFAGIVFTTASTISSCGFMGKEDLWNHTELKQYYYDVNCNWLGLGYDLVYLDPENYAAPAFENPDLSLPPVVFALERGTQSGTAMNGTTFMLPRGVNFFPGSAGSKFDSTLREIKSGNDYRDEMRGSVDLSGEVKGYLSVSGSASFKDVQKRTENSEARIWQVKGEVEGHRLQLKLDSPKELTLSPRFQKAIQNLGDSLSYEDFIDAWGTHFASTTVYGGKAYFKLEVTKDYVKDRHLNQKDFSAAVEGTFKMVSASIGVSGGSTTERTNTEEDLFQKIRSVAYGGEGSVIERNIAAYNAWATSVRENPTVLRLTLTEYSELLTSKFFSDPNIRDKRKHLKSAIGKYLAEHAVEVPESGNFYEETSFFPAGSRIALQADTGKWFARCRYCQNVVRDEFFDTITVHRDQPNVPYARFEVVDVGNGKIALKADTGQYVSRCRNCIVKGVKKDFVTLHVTDPSAPYAQFTPVLLGNGKYALRADTGQYVSRCRNCSPGAKYPDTVTIHIDDPTNAPYAQWKIEIQ